MYLWGAWIHINVSGKSTLNIYLSCFSSCFSQNIGDKYYPLIRPRPSYLRSKLKTETRLYKIVKVVENFYIDTFNILIDKTIKICLHYLKTLAKIVSIKVSFVHHFVLYFDLFHYYTWKILQHWIEYRVYYTYLICKWSSGGGTIFVNIVLRNSQPVDY